MKEFKKPPKPQPKESRDDLFVDGNKIAEEYDLLRMAVPHHDEFQQQVGIEISRYINRVSYESKERLAIIEIGSGTGITTAEIIASAPDAVLTCIDSEEVMLDQARKKDINGDITYISKDAYEYLQSLEEESHDIVASAYTLHNMASEHREQIIREVFRVLKPNGLFINADKIAHSDEKEYQNAYNKQIALLDVFDSVGKTELKNEWVEHYKLDNESDIRVMEDELEKLLERVGFTDIETVWRKLLEAVIVAHKPDEE